MSVHVSLLGRSFAVGVLLFGALTLFATEASEPLPLFQGMMDDAKAPQFGLSNADKTRIGWVKIGQSFDGWKLEEYRRDADVLVLSKNGESRELHLAEASLSKPISEDARALVKAMNFELLRDMMVRGQKRGAMRQVRNELKKRGIENPTPEQMAMLEQTLDREINSRFSAEAMEPEFVNMLAQTYTQDEIRAQREFWESDTGKTLMDQMASRGEDRENRRREPPSAEMMKFFASEEGRSIMSKQRDMGQKMISSIQPKIKEVEAVMSRTIDSISQQNQ